MNSNYFPKINPQDLCEAMQLSCVRQNSEGKNLIAVKRFDGSISEILLDPIVNAETFEDKKIDRIYSSGHVFISDDKKQVYLITVEKNGKKQHQFTGGSPKEEENKNVTFMVDGKVRFYVDAIEHNAELRTFNRTGVKVTETYNELPTVDRALMEHQHSETGEISWRMVCLLHFAVKTYEGNLTPHIGVEEVVGGDWFEIEQLPSTKDVAPNAYIVTKKLLELIG